MLGPIYVIGGLLCWHTYMIQVVKLTKVFGGVLSSMYCIMMSPIERTAEDLLLKCLESDQARVAMGEVHEGICGTHQSAPKMKWLLRRAGFYWPTMMTDCFRYYKGCEEC
jgi:hypothetical protein